MALFVLFLLSPTVQFEFVLLNNDLGHKQHTNSCNQRGHNIRVLVLLYS